MEISRLVRVKDEDISLKHDDSITTCEACDSTNIRRTNDGHVCQDCGLVLSSLILEYHHPYEVSRVQHSPEGTTQIGFYKERVVNSHSIQLKRWQQIDSERGREENVKKIARKEIKRILSGLGRSLADVEPIFKQFLIIRKHFRPGTKFRSVEKSVPIAIFLYFKLNCKGIKEQELLEISNITKKEFNAFKLQLHAFLPEYQTRNRKDYVLQKIFQITEEFELDMEFFDTAKKIMYKFWEIIKNTKDDVIVGVLCSIVALCEEGKRLKVNAICSHLGIQMSTIHRQVERNVFGHLRVKGFTSLVQSSSLLKNVMVKLGLIEQDEEIKSVVQFTLGRAVDIYNAHDAEVLPITPCLLIIETTFNTFLLIDEQYCLIRGEHVNTKHVYMGGVLGDKVISSQFTNYENPKGPP